MIIKDSHFHKLHETKEFIVGHVYEYAYLVSKKNYKEIYMGDFYGDPKCGLIDSANNWCLVGGNMLTVWTSDKEMLQIADERLPWILRARQTAEFNVELLVDPWSDEGSVWALDIQTLERYKIKDYKLSGEYTEHMDW